MTSITLSSLQHSFHCWIVLRRNNFFFLSLVNYQTNIDRIFPYLKNLYEPKCQLLIKMLEKISKKYLKRHRRFPWKFKWYERSLCKYWLIQFDQKSKKIVIIFDDLIENMIINTHFRSKVTDLFILDIRFHHTLTLCCSRTYKVEL